MPDLIDPESGQRFSEEDLDWIGGHMAELRSSVVERRFRNWTLWTALLVGLAVHVAGFLLKSSVTGEPIALLADLLYTLGYALWTGVVVVTIVEIIPAAKERQISRYLDAYESALRSRPRRKDGVPARPQSHSQA